MTGVSRSEQRQKDKAFINSSKKEKKNRERETERLQTADFLLQTGEDQAAKKKKERKGEEV